MVSICEGINTEGDTERVNRAKETFHFLGVLQGAEKHQTKVKLLIDQVNKRGKKQTFSCQVQHKY